MMPAKSYALRQKILLKQGKISQELHDARVAQWRQMKALKKEAAKQDSTPSVDGGGK